MKSFHLVVASTGEQATNLHFLDRGDASKYQKILLWPWERHGYFVTPSGVKHPLSGLQFRIEPVSLPALYDTELDWILWRIDGKLGFVPMVPGRCFDPASWRAVSDHDMHDPIIAPKIAHAERELDDAVKR